MLVIPAVRFQDDIPTYKAMLQHSESRHCEIRSEANDNQSLAADYERRQRKLRSPQSVHTDKNKASSGLLGQFMKTSGDKDDEEFKKEASASLTPRSPGSARDFKPAQQLL